MGPEFTIDPAQSTGPPFGDRRVQSVQVAYSIAAIDGRAQGVGTKQTGGAALTISTSPCVQSTSSAQTGGINTFQSAAVPTNATLTRSPSLGTTKLVDLSEWMRPEPSWCTSMSSKRQRHLKQGLQSSVQRASSRDCRVRPRGPPMLESRGASLTLCRRTRDSFLFANSLYCCSRYPLCISFHMCILGLPLLCFMYLFVHCARQKRLLKIY